MTDFQSETVPPGWWFVESQRCAEQEFSRRGWYYVRPALTATRTEQGWMIDLGTPSIGQLVKNRMTKMPAGGVFEIGLTIGM